MLRIAKENYTGGQFRVGQHHLENFRDMLDAPNSRPSVEIPAWGMEDVKGTTQALVLCKRKCMKAAYQQLEAGNARRLNERAVVTRQSIKISYEEIASFFRASISSSYILLQGEEIPFIAITSEDSIRPWFMTTESHEGPMEGPTLAEELNTIAEELDL